MPSSLLISTLCSAPDSGTRRSTTLFGDGDHDVDFLLVRVLQRQRDRDVEDFAELLDVDGQFAAVDAVS